MGEVLVWIADNWQTVVGVAGSVVMGASVMVHAIAPFTATTKDDEAAAWLDKVYGWLKRIALNKDDTATS